MVMSQGDEVVIIVHVREHYEGYVNGEFMVSGDTVNEVCGDLQEMGYMK